MSVVGENIKMRRKALHLSQMELSRLAGISQSAISDIENPSVTKLPNIDTITKIAAALGCSLDDLIHEVNENEKQMIVLDPQREGIIRDYDNLSADAKQLVRQYIDLLRKHDPDA